MMTRRQLLEQIAATTSLGAMYQAMAVLGLAGETTEVVAASRDELAAARSRLKGKTVLCIGSGISGLVAAYELNKQGVNVEVHEARHKIGGRCETIRHGDTVDELESSQRCEFGDEPHLYFNAGASRIPHRHANIMHYCRELGIDLEPFINENRSTLVHAAPLGDKPVRRSQLSASVRGHLAALAAKAASAADAQIAPEDREGIERLVRMFGDLSANLEFKGSIRLGTTAEVGKAPKILPVIALEEMAKLNWTELTKLFYYERLHQQTPMFQAVGGMDNIAKAFAKPLAQHITTSSALTKVTTLESGKVEAIFSQGDETVRKEADAVVFTMQPSVFGHIEHDFAGEVADAFRRVHLFTSCKVAFEAERFWELDNIYGGGSSIDDDITQIWYPSHGIGKKRGVLIGAYNYGLDPNSDFYKRSPAKRVEAALAQGSKLHGGYRDKVSKGVTRSWPLTPYIQGGFAARRAPAVLLKRHGPYIFAGDYTTYLPGWQEGAILSAHRALALLQEG